jgi:predicted tellurium resistance membrane protein TerC
MPVSELLFTPENLATLLTLTFLEIVLAGDNLVLIAVLSSKLPERQRPLARRLGLIGAVATRILLLLSLFWLSRLETPIDGLKVTPREVIFVFGGLFLIWKGLTEMVTALFGPGGIAMARVKPAPGAFMWVILQIALFDVIFSLDSVTAAIGFANRVEIMIAAVLVAALLMLFLVNPISNFIERNQIVKVAALDLLVLIGVFLLAQAAHYPLPKIELYVALALILIIQAVLLTLLRLPRGLRYGLVIAATVALGAGAVVLVNDPKLAAELSATALNAWRSGVDAVSKAADSIGALVSSR